MIFRFPGKEGMLLGRLTLICDEAKLTRPAPVKRSYTTIYHFLQQSKDGRLLGTRCVLHIDIPGAFLGEWKSSLPLKRGQEVDTLLKCRLCIL